MPSDQSNHRALGIRAIGRYIPASASSTIDRLEEFGLAASFVQDKTGFLSLPRMPAGTATSELCVQAFADLSKRAALDLGDVDCLVVCTQNPDGHGIPHTGSVVHGRLDLPHGCAVFDISLGCSGYVYGLSVVKSFMEANGLRNGLFFTADPYSRIMDDADKDTSLLFGDGASVTWIGEDPSWEIGRARFGSNGKLGAAISVGEEGRLTMNGRSVFTFSATTVPPLIRELLDEEGLAVEDVDTVLLHQGSKYIVDTIRQRLGGNEAAIPFAAAQTGNLVSSSIPFLLADIDPNPDRRCVIAGFGVGLSWGAMLLQGKGNH
jgi:3-oxoacyl-[acyl-carrier-protein] synthase-3